MSHSNQDILRKRIQFLGITFALITVFCVCSIELLSLTPEVTSLLNIFSIAAGACLGVCILISFRLKNR